MSIMLGDTMATSNRIETIEHMLGHVPAAAADQAVVYGSHDAVGNDEAMLSLTLSSSQPTS
jgi:hypothetical protein